MGYATEKALISAATTTGAVTPSGNNGRAPALKTFHLFGSTTNGAGTATVTIQASNDNTNWITIATLSLTLSTTVSSDGCVVNAPWAFHRGNVTGLTGTGASVSLYMGYQEA